MLQADPGPGLSGPHPGLSSTLRPPGIPPAGAAREERTMTMNSPAPWTRDNGQIRDRDGANVALLAVRPGMGASEFRSNAALVENAPAMRECVGETAMMLRGELKSYAHEPWARRVLELQARLWAAETDEASTDAPA